MGRRIVIDDSDEEEEVRKEAVAPSKPVPEDVQENDEDGEEELFGSHSSVKNGNSKRPVEKRQEEPTFGARKRRAAAVSATKRLSDIKNDAYFKEQLASTHKTPRNQRKQDDSDDEEEEDEYEDEGSVEVVEQRESKKRKHPSKSSSSSSTSSSSLPARLSTGRSQRVANARDTERSRTLDKIRRRSDVQRQGMSALDAMSSSDEEGEQDYAAEDDDDDEYQEEEEDEEDKRGHHRSSSSSSSSRDTGKKGRREPSFSLAYSTASSPSRTCQRNSVSVGGGGRSSGRGSGGSAFFRRETLAEPDADVGYYDDDDFIVGSDEEREAEERDAELRRQVMILLSIPNPPLVYILSFHYAPQTTISHSSCMQLSHNNPLHRIDRRKNANVVAKKKKRYSRRRSSDGSSHWNAHRRKLNSRRSNRNDAK